MRRILPLALALSLGLAPMARAGAWIWDNDGDGMDDRIVSVATGGISAAYTGNDPVHGLLRFQVNVAAGVTTFGAYLDYNHPPTSLDVAAAQATGAHVTHTYRNFNILRVTATYAQLTALRALPGVTRVETIQALRPTLDVSARSSRARETDDDALFPAVWKHLGLDGNGVVMAILDTGVNDSVDLLNSSYPGHESLRGRCLGGGDFSAGDSALDRPDINPQDHGGTYHGTHVAGIATGTGGSSQTYRGIAPGARYVDCKVLTDAGVGFGLLDALDWIVSKRDTLWLGPGNPAWRGVQVLNLSLGGPDSSDGQDADAQALNVAASRGMIPIVAMGNDGRARYVPSPASADSAISVAAVKDFNTIRRDDDAIDTSYSNQGPRAGDGDLDHSDELRPLVSAPGTDIVSARGDPITDGSQYFSMTGTSMAAPHVAGLVALLKQARPGLTAGEAMRILRFTSQHRGIANDPFTGLGHPDPDWSSAWGYGEMDAYAAALEALDANTTQIVQIQAQARAGALAVCLKWFTQREVGATGFNVYRSLDSLTGYTRLNGSPVPPVGVPAPPGDSLHAYASNRTLYSWLDGGLTLGQKYFYRISWLDALAFEHFSPPIRAALPASPPLATVRTVYTHDYPDQDLIVRIGIGRDFNNPEWARFLGGTSDADSVITGPGLSYLGTKRWIFHTDLYASQSMPSYPAPSAGHPWFLGVAEGGFLNTSGSVDAFSVTFHDLYGSGRDSAFFSLSPLQHTLEGQTTFMSIPFPVPAGAPLASSTGLRVRLAAANPGPGACAVRYHLPRSGAIRLSLIDLSGREVRLLAAGSQDAGDHSIRFDGRRADGSRLSSGVYWVRVLQGGAAASCKLVLVR